MSHLASEMPGLAQLINPASSSSPPPPQPAPVPPAIGASPASLSFTAQAGASNPTAQTLTVSNTGGGTLSWSASDNAPWLTLVSRLRLRQWGHDSDGHDRHVNHRQL